MKVDDISRQGYFYRHPEENEIQLGSERASFDFYPESENDDLEYEDTHRVCSLLLETDIREETRLETSSNNTFRTSKGPRYKKTSPSPFDCDASNAYDENDWSHGLSLPSLNVENTLSNTCRTPERILKPHNKQPWAPISPPICEKQLFSTFNDNMGKDENDSITDIDPIPLNAPSSECQGSDLMIEPLLFTPSSSPNKRF